MKYKYVILLMLGLLAFNPMLQAQKPGEVKMKKADRYFFLFKFDKAIDQYKRVLEKQPGNYLAERRIADSYRLQNKSVEAEQYYAMTVANPKADSLDYYYYAQSLRNNSKYDSAKAYYNKYAQMAPNDPRGKMLAESMDKVAQMRADSLHYTVALVGDSVNSELSDFSPAFYNDSSLVFPSARSKKKTDVWSGQPFLDLFVAERSNGTFKKPVAISGKVNKRYHQGPATFSPDSKEMYFTRNNYSNIRMKKGEDDIMRMIVVKSSQQADGEWKDLDVLSFNSKDYSVQHPTLSADGKKLYFSSDMPGGFGGFDLYVAEVGAEGKFGTPTNLGETINTRGDEGFPFISQGGDTLFFASDSYVGFGGLDVYVATAKDGKFSNVTNMGWPINGPFDDFGLIMNKQGTGGYFASNRPGGPGSDDIYSWSKGGPCINLKAIVYDRQTGDPIPAATVKIVAGTDTLVTLTADGKGEIKYCVPRNTTILLLATKDGYLPNKMNVNTSGIDENSPPVRIPLDKEGLRLVGTAFEVKVNDATKIEGRIGTLGGVTVQLEDLTARTLDSVTSDGSGGFVFILKPDHEYKLTGDKELYFLKSEVNFDTKGLTTGVVSKDIELYKFEGTIRLVNIYYNFDKYNIRPDAAKELDRLYGYLLKYPDMVIQMRSHTDCRAGKTYNMILSANRAQSAANYLIMKGTKEKKDMLKNITASGFGETLPVYPNLCSTEQGVPDNKLSKDIVDKHQTNRRTEFYVVKQPKAIHVESSPIVKK